MATTVTPKSLRERAPAFNTVSDTLVQGAIDEAVRWTSETQWGPSHFDDGVFYLACHILEEDAALSADGLKAGETGAALPPGPVQSEKILTWSVSYAVAEGGSFDDALATTAWGRRYIARRQLVCAAMDRRI